MKGEGREGKGERREGRDTPPPKKNPSYGLSTIKSMQLHTYGIC